MHSRSLENDHDQSEHRTEQLIPSIFAYGSDLTADGKSETTRYDEVRGFEEPANRLICVVGRSLWFWQDTDWVTWKFNFEHDEICGFMAATINSLQRILQTRRRRDFRAYLGWNVGSVSAATNLVQG